MERSFYDYQKFKEEKKKFKKVIEKNQEIQEQERNNQIQSLENIIEDNSSQENESGDDSEKDSKEESGSNENSQKSDESATSANNNITNNDEAEKNNENQPFQINNVDDKNNKLKSIKSGSIYEKEENSDDSESDEEEEKKKYKHQTSNCFKGKSLLISQSHLDDVPIERKKSDDGNLSTIKGHLGDVPIEKKKSTAVGPSGGKLSTIKGPKETIKIPGTDNNNNPRVITKNDYNQNFFNVTNKIIKFFEDNDVIDTKIKMKSPMSVLNKLKTASDSSQRNELLEKLEKISNKFIKANKEKLATQY